MYTNKLSYSQQLLIKDHQNIFDIDISDNVLTGTNIYFTMFSLYFSNSHFGNFTFLINPVLLKKFKTRDSMRTIKD